MTPNPTDGILILDKPHGISSMETVRRIKRASGIKRVGHGGTLDPMATGVIPICVGRATRLMEYILDSSKEYVGDIRLGIATDTYDSEGEITSQSDPSCVTREQVEDVLKGFLGRIEQVPPMYSALKRQGKRLYELARQGIEVEREPRPMTVHGIRLSDWKPPVVRVHIECGRGFYMRSLAHDIGVLLGCGAHLQSLTRLRTGRFHITGAVSIKTAQRSFEDGSWPDLLHSPDSVLGEMRAIIVERQTQNLVQNGRPISLDKLGHTRQQDERCRAYSMDGEFLAIMRFDFPDNAWCPEKVFSPSNAQRTSNSG